MLQLTTIFFLITGSILAVTHVLALKFYLYWRYLWLDMPMHFLGGVVVGLLLYTLYDLRLSLVPRTPRWFTVVLFVLMVAMMWEIYEVLIGIPMLEDYLFDTVSDLIFGGVGGVVAFLLGNQFRKLSL